MYNKINKNIIFIESNFINDLENCKYFNKISMKNKALYRILLKNLKSLHVRYF